MNKTDENIRYTPNGDIDIDYYKRKAEALRGEYLALQFSAFWKGAKKVWHIINDKLSSLNWQPSH